MSHSKDELEVSSHGLAILHIPCADQGDSVAMSAAYFAQENDISG